MDPDARAAVELLPLLMHMDPTALQAHWQTCSDTTKKLLQVVWKAVEQAACTKAREQAGARERARCKKRTLQERSAVQDHDRNVPSADCLREVATAAAALEQALPEQLEPGVESLTNLAQAARREGDVQQAERDER